MQYQPATDTANSKFFDLVQHMIALGMHQFHSHDRTMAKKKSHFNLFVNFHFPLNHCAPFPLCDFFPIRRLLFIIIVFVVLHCYFKSVDV